MERPEFKRQLVQLQKEIFNASVFYDVRLALWQTEEVINILNRHKDFFVPVQRALYVAMFIGMAKIFDLDSRTVSLENLLKRAAENREELVPRMSPQDIIDLRESLNQHSKVRDAINRERNQNLAHSDAHPDPSLPKTMGEIDSLLETVDQVFNRLSSSHDGQYFSHDFQRDRSAGSATEILTILQEEEERRQKRHETELREIEDSFESDT